MKNDFIYLKTFLLYIIPVFLLNLLVFQLPILKEAHLKFVFQLPFLYLLFAIFSKTIIFILTKVSQKSFDNTGITFMIATFIKTAICYGILKPVIDGVGNNIEKATIFGVFIVFLLMESLVTIKILNKKQS